MRIWLLCHMTLESRRDLWAALLEDCRTNNHEKPQCYEKSESAESSGHPDPAFL